MDIEVSDVIVGILMIVFGVLGLFIAAGAMDIEMYVFGLGLFILAVCFVFGQVRRVSGARRAAHAEARGPTHV